jgi:hypothetical protein
MFVSHMDCCKPTTPPNGSVAFTKDGAPPPLTDGVTATRTPANKPGSMFAAMTTRLTLGDATKTGGAATMSNKGA